MRTNPPNRFQEWEHRTYSNHHNTSHCSGRNKDRLGSLDCPLLESSVQKTSGVGSYSKGNIQPMARGPESWGFSPTLLNTSDLLEPAMAPLELE